MWRSGGGLGMNYSVVQDVNQHDCMTPSLNNHNVSVF